MKIKLQSNRYMASRHCYIYKDRTLQEIISYFQDYLSDAEYQQQKQTDFIDGVRFPE